MLLQGADLAALPAKLLICILRGGAVSLGLRLHHVLECTSMSKVVVSLLAASALATTAGAARAPAPSDSRVTPEAAVLAYCGAWSITDGSARDRQLARVWAANGVYMDPEPTLARGLAGLSDAIAEFQKHYPGNRFRCSAPQMDHRSMRVSWVRLGPDGRELSQGMDFYDLALDGRISRIVGFFGAPPAP